MPVQYAPFPPAAPVITGDLKSVSVFLNNVPYVQRTVTDLTAQRFLADRIFGAGPTADGGAVQYDQVTGSDLYPLGDVEPISPLGEYPLISDQIPTPLVAKVTKWGARVVFSEEDIRRNRIDVLRRNLIKLRNTIVRKVDTVAIATLNAAPILSFGFGSVWSSTSTDVFAGLTQAKLLGESLDMGYVYDTLVVNPAQEANLLSRADIREAFGPQAQEDIIRNATVGKILDLNVYKTNRVPAGTAYLLAAGVVGGISDEVPQITKVYPKESSDALFVQSARIFVPFVTDPKACIKLTGL